MSDEELIARLRGRSQFCKDRGEVKSPDLMNEAADRIEALIAERDAAREYAGEVRKREMAAEDARISATDKLAKAVEALLTIVDNGGAGSYHLARATLAEIKSGVATTPYGLKGESHE